MQTYFVKEGKELNYDKLNKILSGCWKNIVFGQYLEQGDQIWTVPGIFIGTINDLDSRNIYIEGVGGCLQFHTGQRFVSLIKRYSNDKSQKIGLARIVNEERKVIFQDDEVAQNWDNAYKNLIRQVHVKSEDKKIKEWLDMCQCACFQYHSLMDVYLPKRGM
jgi:hypothetical protein